MPFSSKKKSLRECRFSLTEPTVGRTCVQPCTARRLAAASGIHLEELLKVGAPMSSTNGHEKRAILYARVSAEEQARSGLSSSIDGGSKRIHSPRRLYELLEEVTDPNQRGA